MEEYKIKGCALVKITGQQMQIRGGVTWKDILNITRYVKRFFDFIDEYREDIERGFEKGWRMF